MLNERRVSIPNAEAETAMEIRIPPWASKTSSGLVISKDGDPSRA